MSKELVISANRHETRVAMIEDDQVVEIFHQRENEYSLAGSIHKGRVTRVLPGMQSAFVDIGLERDAFLYVSDFFEDNDEYDKIVTGVEEKVLKLDRTGQPVPATAEAAPLPASIVSDGAPAVAAAEPAAPAVAGADAPAPMGPPAPHQGHSDQRRDDRDSRGRRGRRRRGGKGRGALPDSKFYSPGPRGGHEAPPAAQIPEAAPRPEIELAASSAALAASEGEDFLVLPGESLAKYTAGADEAETPGAAADVSDDVEDIDVEFSEPGAEDAAEEAIAEPDAEPAPVAAAVHEPEPISEPELQEPPVDIEEPEPEPEPESEPEPEPDTEGAEMTEAEVLALEAEAGMVEEPALDETEPAGAEGEEALVVEFEGPEPARIPTSLTATLREQGPRYQHRVSRRMRRKGRGGDRDNRGPLPGGVAEATRAPEVRPESRPDQRPDQRGEQRTGQGRNIPETREKSATPSISDLLKEGQEIIVQIAKEPLGQKGARITSHIALPGRFLVYMPTVDHIGVSRKIPSDDERLRLKRIL